MPRGEGLTPRPAPSLIHSPPPLEMSSVSLLPPHHDPHGAPLGQVDGFDDPGDLVDEGDGAGDVVKDLAIPDLLPRHRHVLHQFQHGVRHVLEGAQINALVVAEFSAIVYEKKRREKEGKEGKRNERRKKWKGREEEWKKRKKNRRRREGKRKREKKRRSGIGKENKRREGKK